MNTDFELEYKKLNEAYHAKKAGFSTEAIKRLYDITIQYEDPIGILETLVRAFKGSPLSPLTLDDDEWCARSYITEKHMNTISSYNKRYPSLIKYTTSYGTTEYLDMHRIMAIQFMSLPSANRYSIDDAFSQILGHIVPINFPYMPEEKPYKFSGCAFGITYNPFMVDTVGRVYIKKPDGTELKIEESDSWWKKENGMWIRISRDEYQARKSVFYVISNKIEKEFGL